MRGPVLNGGTPGKEAGRDRRELILEAALRLFTAEGGYFHASVHDIRREADVSIGSIYHHFKNKEAIAKALYDKVVCEMAEAVEEIRATYHTAHDRCRAIIACLYDMVEQTPATMRYIIYAQHREFMPDEPPICSSRPFELMKDIVEDGIRDGEIRQLDPMVAATNIFGGAIRMIHLRLDGALPGSLVKHLEQTWQCAWRGVMAD